MMPNPNKMEGQVAVYYDEQMGMPRLEGLVVDTEEKTVTLTLSNTEFVDAIIAMANERSLVGILVGWVKAAPKQ